MKKALFLVLALVFLAGAVVFYLQWNKPHRNPADETGVKITAEELFSKYESNESDANTSYLNKTLEVSGTIMDSGVNQDGEPTLTLNAGNEMFGVLITFNPTEKEKVSAKQNGDKVTLKGICSGYTTDVIIKDAVLVE
jgi:hypothetical protein